MEKGKKTTKKSVETKKVEKTVKKPEKIYYATGEQKDLKSIDGVIDIHDLHVWCLSIGKISMSCHLSCKNPQKTLVIAHKLLKKKYKISHTTIQVEDVKRDINCRHSLH